MIFESHALQDYPEVHDVDFPAEIAIAFAVCSKQCGAREYIVDGSTQVCQHCGHLMFRTEVRTYQLVDR